MCEGGARKGAACAFADKWTLTSLSDKGRAQESSPERGPCDSAGHQTGNVGWRGLTQPPSV